MSASVKYTFEIYEPGSTEDVWVAFETNTPLYPMNKGEIINPNIWSGSEAPAIVLRIVNVVHVIWEAEGLVKDTMCVYTEKVENNRELYFET